MAVGDDLLAVVALEGGAVCPAVDWTYDFESHQELICYETAEIIKIVEQSFGNGK